ncbi:hypothetical protein NA57DRAFT_13223, partial [Rhizodiscina lignyota]
DAPKKEIWSSMLDGVSSGRRLPEKTAFILGGTPSSQRDFLASLSTEPKTRRPQDRSQPRQPPVANSFALGYTYQDVMDADQEDTLARLSLYLLHTPSTSFAPLLRPLLTPSNIPHSTIVILLDWNEPWSWLRQLRAWIRALRQLMLSLDDECKYALEDNMKSWREGKSQPSSGASANADAAPSTDEDVQIPLGPGEWDAPLGLPLIVVAQNASHIENLEKERGWKDEEFDFILQYLRTVLLKHGAALMYTMPAATVQTNAQLQTLVHSCLGITNLLGKDRGGGTVKHNVVDRERVLVPVRWDSWGKIRILREGFDVEGVSKQWGQDIEKSDSKDPQSGDTSADEPTSDAGEPDTADSVTLYEDIIRSPDADNVLISTSKASSNGTSVEVQAQDQQQFLGQQLEILERLRLEDEREKASNAAKKPPSALPPVSSDGGRSASAASGSGVVEEHIGPVQFNMGGIQVDAEDVVRRIKTLGREPHENMAVASPGASTPSATDNMDSDTLMSFFSGLAKR